jgi:hypothetical protein
MHESFHTEDCGLSLICRCCRARVCERTLAKGDRLRIRRELWAHGAPRHRHGASAGHVKSFVRMFVRGFASGFLSRVTRPFLERQ